MNNREIWVIERCIGIFSKLGELEYLDGFISNINDQKRVKNELVTAQQEIYKLAYTDLVTNLANKNLFNDRLDQTLSYSQRYETQFAVVLLTLMDLRWLMILMAT